MNKNNWKDMICVQGERMSDISIRYEVVVVGEPMQDFTNPMSAIDYAARHVYLPAESAIAALNALKRGVKFSYSYGFKEAHLTPVKS